MDLKVFVLTLVLVATSVNSQGPLESAIQNSIIEFLEPYDDIYIPLIPTINVHPDYNPNIDISLSITDVHVYGLTNLTVNLATDLSRTFDFAVTFTSLHFDAAHYSAGGHLVSLPFNGESFMRIQLEDVMADVSMEYKPLQLCADVTTAEYVLSIRKPFIYFDELNPGTDQGQFINIIAGTLVGDVVKYIDVLLAGPFHDKAVEITEQILGNNTCIE